MRAEQPSGAPPSEDLDRLPPEDRRYQGVLLGVVMLAVMAFGSLMTLVTVALGTIAEELDSTRATLTWVVTGPMLATAIAAPIAGKLGDLYGHRRIFLFGLAGGALSTALCASAWNGSSLIAFRAMVGLSGAMVMPSGMALMMHAYGAPRRAAAIGWFQFAMTGAPTIGLVVGGPLTDVVGWRAIFAIFALVSVLAFLAGIVLLRATPRQRGVALDVVGALSLAAGVLAGLLAITRAAEVFREDAPLLGDVALWSLLGAAGASLALFVAVERRITAPMLELDHFRKRSFTLPILASALFQFAYMGGFVVTPALLSDHYGWGIGAIALLMVPRPGAFSLASPLGGYLATRIGERRPIIWGGCAMVASMAAFLAAALHPSALGIALIVLGLVLSGVSAGISQPSVASMVVGAVPQTDHGVATGMNQQIMFIGIVAGIQTMNVLVGDGGSRWQFATTYILGGSVAFLGLLAALSTRDSRAGVAGVSEPTRPARA